MRLPLAAIENKKFLFVYIIFNIVRIIFLSSTQLYKYL